MQDHAFLCARENKIPCGQEWKRRNLFLTSPSFHFIPIVHRSLLGLTRTMKIWSTRDTFTPECCSSHLCLCHATTQRGKKKRNTDVFALLSFLPPQRSASSPSVGKEHRPASFRKRLQVQERTSNGDHP